MERDERREEEEPEDEELLQLGELYRMLKEDAHILGRGLINSVKFFKHLSIVLIAIGLLSAAISLYLVIMQGVLLAGVILLILGLLVVINAIILWRYYSNMVKRFAIAKIIE